MPVTAKLSKAFYDRLGEQIANELVEWFNQVDDTLHRELREQTRFMVGVITALWAALLIPIVGLWMR